MDLYRKPLVCGISRVVFHLMVIPTAVFRTGAFNVVLPHISIDWVTVVKEGASNVAPVHVMTLSADISDGAYSFPFPEITSL